MIVHDVQQGSPEWHKLRLGVVTASDVDALVTPEFKVRTGVGVQSYVYRKVAEKICGFQLSDAGSFAMDQGHFGEMQARPWYEFTEGVRVRTVGFITSDCGRYGCSPDGLVGEDGGIEVKSPQPAKAVEYLVGGVCPKEHLAQVHFCLWITGRAWWDFICYSNNMPPMIVRVRRDESICAKITEALENFTALFDAAHAKVAAMKADYFQQREQQATTQGRD